MLILVCGHVLAKKDMITRRKFVSSVMTQVVQQDFTVLVLMTSTEMFESEQ